MKTLNRLLLLGLLGILGSPAGAQTLTSIRIALSDPDARFIVDGQIFNYNQNFVWPEGSTHVVEFPLVTDVSDSKQYQYHPSGRSRYTFGGWTAVSTIPVTLAPSNVVYITASRNLTELLGGVIKYFPVEVEFTEVSSNPSCTLNVEENQIDRQGVIVIDGACYAKSQTIWMNAGMHTFRAYPYPGYYFAGMLIGSGLKNLPPAFDLEVNSTTSFGPLFARAKRVRFTTTPPGLQVLIDRAPVTPQVPFAFNPDNWSDYCGMTSIPIKVPLGIRPLCIGDFDFIPGSAHQIAAQPIQTDPKGDYWVFDRFSNGMGQNSTLIAPNDFYSRTDINAEFIHGVRSSIDTSEAGLKVVIDGSDVPPNGRYGFIWAEGSTHHLNPPETQRDTKGRVWKFVRWSDDGPRERDITVPTDGGDYRIIAFFEILGQVKVTSNPPGMDVSVNGADCRTPCTYDQDPGTTLTLNAPTNIAIGEGSRYEFAGWAGHTAGRTQQVTFSSDVQVYHAQYSGAHRVLAYSDPDGAARFKFTPESADGFFAEGTSVLVEALPNTGFKFLVWDQDLTGREPSERLTIYGPMSVVAKLKEVPAIAPAGIRNAAGDTPDGTVAPGSIISIYGANLTDELEIGPSNPLAQFIGDIYVTVNGRLLPLIFVSPNQINAQLLSSLPDGDYTLTVHNVGKDDINGTVKVKRNSPGVFYNLTADGMPLIAALHQDGSPITQESPARKGETISFFGTGLGIYDRPVIDGFLLPSTDIYKLLDPVKVLAGLPGSGAPAGANAADVPPAVRDPAFAGGAAGMVGTNLIKVTLDSDLPAGKVLELSLSVNGSLSNKVQLPVQ